MLDFQFHSEVYEAAHDPERWPEALRIVAETLGFVGASYRLLNNRTQLNDWIGTHGPTSRGKADYLAYYHQQDRLVPSVQAASPGVIVRLRDTLPDGELGKNEWLNDHLMRDLGIDDALSTTMFRTHRHTGILTVHHGIGRRPIEATDLQTFSTMIEPFAKAARLHAMMKEVSLQAAAAMTALADLSAGVLIADENCLVCEMNDVAERMAREADGFTVQLGCLQAAQAPDGQRLAQLVATAARLPETPTRRMRLARRSGRPDYTLSVAPFDPGFAMYDRSFARIVVVKPEARAASGREMGELFGLSPAEAEIATALVEGKSLTDIATDRGVKITTIRSQLDMAKKKLRVRSQVELVRRLSGSGIGGAL